MNGSQTSHRSYGLWQTTVCYRGRGALFDRYKFDRKDRWVAQRSENVGISNEKTGEIPVRRKPKESVRKVHPLRVSRYLSRGREE